MRDFDPLLITFLIRIKQMTHIGQFVIINVFVPDVTCSLTYIIFIASVYILLDVNPSFDQVYLSVCNYTVENDCSRPGVGNFYAIRTGLKVIFCRGMA